MADIRNSFTETTNKMLSAVNIALEFAQKTNQSLTTQEDSVVINIEEEDPITGEKVSKQYAIPSYSNVINKVNTAQDTVDVFTKGEGMVLLKDGTYREVKVGAIPVSPKKIENIAPPATFSTKNNWFFESLMSPQIVVSFDLKGKVDDRADQILVRRIIFDNYNSSETRWFLNSIANKQRTYFEVITILQNNRKKFFEDNEIHDLVLTTEPYAGYFLIKNKKTIGAKEWYYLDTLKYGVPSDLRVVKTLMLAKGDKLRFKNSIYRINNINISERRVQLINLVGMDHPTVSKRFEIYSDPFSTKTVKIPVGYNECNALFLKGINDDYNIIGDEWSDSISFYTNNLKLFGSDDTLEKYYNLNVLDFGKEIEGRAKEKFIPAWYGIVPPAPTLKVDDFQVTQINTQLNSALDVNEIKNTQVQIESTKTIVNSLKSTIAQQKADLVALTDTAQRSDLNEKIAINVNELSKRTIEYQSLVRSLYTIAYENDIVNVSPKYRVRGFYEIPRTVKPSPNSRQQSIIQFEILYRYLKMDNTGVDLKTYEYVGSKTGSKKRGVFTDWILISSPIKERVYDYVSQSYKWVAPNIADGQKVNINQIDLPIRKGEKLQMKIRSISEAGWPGNPLKSLWSNDITIVFPPNLSESDQVNNILNDSVIEENTIKLDETLNASGVITHIADSIPNPVSGEGTYFKHQAINLAFDLSQKDSNNTITETSTTNLQTQLSNLPVNTFITLTRPTDAVNTNTPQVTGTLQKWFQAAVNMDPSIYEEFETLVG